MASVTGITAAKALEILGGSVVSGFINGSGHLILVRENGQNIDAGDFTAIVTDIMDASIAQGITDANIPATVAAEVSDQVAGNLFAKGDISGTVSFAGITAATLVNATITAKLVGNITIDSANLPANPKPGTQFAMRLTQDATGGRTLTLSGIKRSQGVLTLSTGSQAIDILVFMFDGTNWYAGPMGIAFS